MQRVAGAVMPVVDDVDQAGKAATKPANTKPFLSHWCGRISCSSLTTTSRDGGKEGIKKNAAAWGKKISFEHN
jgi:hypothetical protein